MSLATTALASASSALSSAKDQALNHLQSAVQALLGDLIAQWRTDTRLYTLESASSQYPLPADLMVESFVLTDAVSQPFHLHIQALALNAGVELKQLYARPISLVTALADGSTVRRSGYVTEAQSLDSDGGLARKSLLVQPWIALLGHTRNSRVWQDMTVIDIVEDVFADHEGIAAWRWDDDVPSFVANGLHAPTEGARRYCVQYRESDLDFVQRLLAEEGLSWRVEEDAQAPGGHTVVIFSSSLAQPQDLTSATQLGGKGIRFHRSSSQEEQDSIQSLGAWRQLGQAGGSMGTTVLGWDEQSNRAVVADVPTNHQWGGPEASNLQSWLTSYDPVADGTYRHPAQAQFAATTLQQAREARLKLWMGEGTVRTLQAGTWFGLAQSTLDSLNPHEQDKEFFVTAVRAMGINNLPKDLSDAIAKTLGVGPLQALLQATQDSGVFQRHDVATDALQAKAAQGGFANQFEAIRRNVHWRTVLMDETGLRPRPHPTAWGPQTAIVVGPNGSAWASGADEIHTDALGRVRVRFHWQANPFAPQRANSDHSCWMRVMQRSAGPGMGQQFIPRIGQEVLVGFLNNDIDQPFVLASLYNGQGQGGTPPTPGGQAQSADTTAFADSTDHHPSAQGNLINSGTGGNSPPWHGAAPGQPGQNNAAAMSGIKSKELGGDGYNQLVFDDTPSQLRTQLHSTQSQTWLQMGHLLHQADNHRGSFRGQGFELRTDAWGGLRAARGVMLTTFGLGGGAGQPATPAGDNAPGTALAKQAQQLASTFNQAAATHQTVALASAQGDHAKLPQNLGHTLPDTQLPHMEDANLAIVGKAGVGITAGQDWIVSANDTTQIASGQDSQIASGGQARIHTGQAMGILAGAIQAGNEAMGKGLSLIAAQGDIDLQAQAGPAQVASKQALEIKSANGAINIASAKKITLAVAGGASITIEGGSFKAECPGKIMVQAGMKSMVGGGTMSWQMPTMPQSVCVACLLSAA
ncbi:MAG: type VI secretion system tip protein VgrG, partial [Burkholderiales bacterium]|nr:type VI secretion system tip protein VgrG [Burkholderiales bacterium]